MFFHCSARKECVEIAELGDRKKGKKGFPVCARPRSPNRVYYEWKIILSQFVIVSFIDGTAVAITTMPNMTIANIASFGVLFSPLFTFRG